jgi:tetratricopeptide (TPR) repeat protein
MSDIYDMSGDFRHATINIKSTIRGGIEIRLPWQLPPRPEHFTGREDELAWLTAELQPGRRSALCGPGGIGKTALASEALWCLDEAGHLQQRFPDGVLFYSFYGQPDPALAFEHFVRSYDEGASDTTAAAAHRVLAGKRALLLLDGTEECADLQAVLDVAGTCGLLITSRKHSDAPAALEDLDPLPEDQAIGLLQDWANAPLDPETARPICQLLGRLPLALRLAGRYLRNTAQTPAEYLAWLQTTPLDALDQGKRRLESVPHLLQHSLEQVGEEARHLLALLGLLALAPFQPIILASALDLDETTLRRPLDQLVNFGLLTRLPTPLPDPHTPDLPSVPPSSPQPPPAPPEAADPAETSPPSGGPGGPYAVTHALIHTYAHHHLPVDDDTAGRLAVVYTYLAKTESEQGLPGYRILDPERPHLLRLIAVCTERGHWAGAKDLVWAVDGYLAIQGHTVQRQQALQTGLTAAQKLANRRDEGAFLDNLGIAYYALGQVEQAIDYYEQALAIDRQIGYRQGEASALGNLALVYAALGQLEQAIDYHRQALAIHYEIGDHQGQANRLDNLGIAYRALGQLEQAIDYHRQALVIARQIGDRRGQASALGNLGLAYRDLGQVEQAIDFHRQALVIARQIGDRRGQASALGNLGLAYWDQGQVEQAIDYHWQALVIARQIGDRRGQASALGNLGLAYYALGQVEQAIDFHRQALVIHGEIGYRQGEADNLGNLGLAYAALGQVEQAIANFQQALAIDREIRYRRGEASQLGNLGNAHRVLGQIEKARDYLTQALHLFEAIKSPYADRVRRQLADLDEQPPTQDK